MRWMSNTAWLAIFSILTSLFLIGCDKKNDELWMSERAQIRAYLQNKGISNYVEDSTAGLFYYFTTAVDTSLSHPNNNSIVEVNYIGSFLDETVFYTTYSSGQTELISLGSAIAGWQLALPHFHVGSRGVVLLPSRLAYGKKGVEGSIPENSILIFDIDLVEVHPHF